MLSFFCLLSTKKVLNYPNNLIYITTIETVCFVTALVLLCDQVVMCFAGCLKQLFVMILPFFSNSSTKLVPF